MKINKVLLVQPLHEKSGGQKDRISINFPFSLGYVAAALEQAGFNVQVIDSQALQLDKEELMEKISHFDFDILGITSFSTQYNAVKIISEFVKNQLKKKVIVGGPLATYSAELTLKTTPIDFCVIGEGELTAVDLLRNMEQPEKVLGIAYRKEDKVIFNPPRPYIKNLDDLPRPAYHLFPMEKYLRMNLFTPEMAKYRNLRTMSFITARGCPYQCKFCSRSFSGLRMMSVKKVIEELQYLKEKYQIGGIAFDEELFVSSHDWMREFLPEMKKLNLVWSALARANTVTPEILKSMKEAGCVGTGYGIETGSQKLLDNMQKGITVKQIENAMKWTKEAGLWNKVQVMFGYPGENEETRQETIELFKRIDHPGRRFSFLTPLPGSAVYEEAKAMGKITNEITYLTTIEKCFAYGKVMVNFTVWPDNKVWPIIKKTERTIKGNYLKRHDLPAYLLFLFNNFKEQLKNYVKAYLTIKILK